MSTQLPRNAEKFQKLDAHARSQYVRYFGEAIPAAPRRGPVEVDYWSISYKLAFPERSIFVKIPKVDRYEADVAAVVMDQLARESAQVEFDGFRQIHKIGDWPTGCAAVRPLEYVPSFNSILTEYVPSEDLFRQCRRAVFRSILPLASKTPNVHLSLNRCGAWLRHFQRVQKNTGPIQAGSAQLLADIRLWSAEIKEMCVYRPLVDSVLGRLEKNPWSQELPAARACEGFEVRNVIVDRTGTIRIVDPGQISRSSGFEDVAHFLVSLTMLFWGTPALWLGIFSSRPYRQSFLDGWEPGDRKVDRVLIAWFETWEWFREWREACRVVAQKPYSLPVRRLLRAAYVDGFFLNRIDEASTRAVGKSRTDETRFGIG